MNQVNQRCVLRTCAASSADYIALNVMRSDAREVHVFFT